MSTKQADYKKNSLSLIVTVFNEAKTIKDLLISYQKQSLLADEMIIVDAGSSDQTVALIEKFSKENPKLRIKVFQKEGNRSIGRNLAVEKAKGAWIAITDAGCILDQNWLKKLMEQARESKARVVAGYYKGTAKTLLQEAFLPYFLVMPEHLDENNFLPATRSMLISKDLWNELGGLDESLDVEDYQMAMRIKSQGEKIAFAKEAIVNWAAPSDWQEFALKTFSFAAGDVEGGVFRKKVLLVFLRYILGILSLFFLSPLAISFLLLAYALWSISKNYKSCLRSWFYLPLVQIVSDFLVMAGTMKAKIKAS